MSEERPLKRVRQACENCRRKKSRCPGEKPVCSYCTRLGQACVYENDTPRVNDHRQSVMDATPETENYQKRMENRIESLEASLREVLGAVRCRQQSNESRHMSPMGTPMRMQIPISSDLQEERPRSLSTSTLPPWHLILDSAKLYLTYCDCQPLPLFVRETFMSTLITKTQEPEILFALLALTVRFSTAAYFRENLQDWIKGYAETARSLVMKRISEGPVEMSTLQSLCLLTLIDHTNGNTQRASIHSGLAMALAQCAGLFLESEDPISDIMREERRRCFWSICLLRQLHGADCRLLELSEEDEFPLYPASVRQPPSSTNGSLLSQDGVPLRTDKPDLGIVAYAIQLSDVWYKTTKYGRRRSKPSQIPPWSPHSEYATIMASEMDYETRMAPVHRYKPSDFANRTSEELNSNREYWGPWIFVQFLYHTNLCLLNHPLLFSLRLRNITSMIPEIFLQHTEDLIVSHATWIVHLIDVLEAKSFYPSDPFLGHCAAIAATIFLQESYKPRETGSNEKEVNFAKCLKFVRNIAVHWPHVSRIANKLQKLKDTVSETYLLNAGTPNRRLLIDLGRFWEILEYPSASERSFDSKHFGASLYYRKSNDTSEVLDTSPLPEPVRINSIISHESPAGGPHEPSNSMSLDDLASASEIAATMHQMDDSALYSNDELAVLAESFFQQRNGNISAGMENWGFSQTL